jgi:hypothetical protein
MTAQDVINSTATDIRGVLSTAAPDALIFIPWVDRIHKDCLHTSLFNHLIQSVQTVNVTVNTSTYTLGNPARRITMVYDRTFDRIVLPVDALALPTTKGDAQDSAPASIPKPMISAATSEQWPEYYRRIGATNLYLFPAPQKTAFAGTYEIHYEGYAPDLVALTDSLLIPNDGKDLVTAGVNREACQYLKLAAEAQYWAAVYESMKKGIGV